MTYFRTVTDGLQYCNRAVKRDHLISDYTCHSRDTWLE